MFQFNDDSEQPEKVMFYLVLKRDLNEIKKYLEINSPEVNGSLCVVAAFTAVHQGAEDIVRYLFEKNYVTSEIQIGDMKQHVAKNIRCSDMPLLYVAVLMKHMTIVKLLCNEYKFDINEHFEIVDKDGFAGKHYGLNPLLYLSMKGVVGCLDALFKVGNVNINQYAVKVKDKDMGRKIFKKLNGYNALHLAIYKRHKEIVKSLIYHGIDIGAEVKKSHNSMYAKCKPLKFAEMLADNWGKEVDKRRVEIVNILISNSNFAAVKDADTDNLNILHRSIIKKRYTTVELLMTKFGEQFKVNSIISQGSYHGKNCIKLIDDHWPLNDKVCTKATDLVRAKSQNEDNVKNVSGQKKWIMKFGSSNSDTIPTEITDNNLQQNTTMYMNSEQKHGNNNRDVLKLQQATGFDIQLCFDIVDSHMYEQHNFRNSFYELHQSVIKNNQQETSIQQQFAIKDTMVVEKKPEIELRFDDEQLDSIATSDDDACVLAPIVKAPIQRQLLNIVKHFMMQYKSSNEKKKNEYNDFLTEVTKYNGVYCLPLPCSVLYELSACIATYLKENIIEESTLNEIKQLFVQLRVIKSVYEVTNTDTISSHQPDDIDKLFLFDKDHSNVAVSGFEDSIKEIFNSNMLVVRKLQSQIIANNKRVNTATKTHVINSDIANTMLFEQIELLNANQLPDEPKTQLGIVISPPTGLKRKCYAVYSEAEQHKIKVNHDNNVISFILCQYGTSGIEYVVDLSSLSTIHTAIKRVNVILESLSAIKDFIKSIQQKRYGELNNTSIFSTIDLSHKETLELKLLLQPQLTMSKNEFLAVFLMRTATRGHVAKNNLDKKEGFHSSRKKAVSNSSHCKEIDTTAHIFKQQSKKKHIRRENRLFNENAHDGDNSTNNQTPLSIIEADSATRSMHILQRLTKAEAQQSYQQRQLTPAKKLSALTSINSQLQNLIDTISTDMHLYPYQKQGLTQIVKNMPNVLLADDMGLGKTITSIAAIKLIIRLNQYINVSDKKHVIIIAKKNIIPHWHDKLRKYKFEENDIHVLNNKNKSKSIRNNSIILVAPNMLRRKLEGFEATLLQTVCGYLPRFFVEDSKGNSLFHNYGPVICTKLYDNLFDRLSNLNDYNTLFREYTYKGKPRKCLSSFPSIEQFTNIKKMLNTDDKKLLRETTDANIKKLLLNETIRTYLMKKGFINEQGALLKINKAIDLFDLYQNSEQLEKIIPLDVINKRLNVLRSSFSVLGFVVDEVHTILSHKETKNAQCFRHIVKSLRILKSKKQPILNLYITGTPFKNNINELAELLSLIAPDVYPNVNIFKQSYKGYINNLMDYIKLAAEKNTADNISLLRQVLQYTFNDIKMYINKYSAIIVRRERGEISLAEYNNMTQQMTIPPLVVEKVSYDLSDDFKLYVEENYEAVLGLCRSHKQTSLPDCYTIGTNATHSRRGGAMATEHDLDILANHPLHDELSSMNKKQSIDFVTMCSSVTRIIEDKYQNSPDIFTRHNGRVKTVVELAMKLLDEKLPENVLPTKIIIPCKLYALMALFKIALERLAKIEVLVFHGGMSTDERKQCVNDFNTANKSMIILVSDAGSEGMELSTANKMIMIKDEWAHSNDAQRIARMHRLGNKHEKLTLYIVENTNNPLDNKRIDTAEYKKEEFQFYLGGKPSAHDLVQLCIKRMKHDYCVSQPAIIAYINAANFKHNLKVTVDEVDRACEEASQLQDTKGPVGQLEGVEHLEFKKSAKVAKTTSTVSQPSSPIYTERDGVNLKQQQPMVKSAKRKLASTNSALRKRLCIYPSDAYTNTSSSDRADDSLRLQSIRNGITFQANEVSVNHQPSSVISNRSFITTCNKNNKRIICSDDEEFMDIVEECDSIAQCSKRRIVTSSDDEDSYLSQRTATSSMS